MVNETVGASLMVFRIWEIKSFLYNMNIFQSMDLGNLGNLGASVVQHVEEAIVTDLGTVILPSMVVWTV